MFSNFRSRTESKKFFSARWRQRSDNGRSIARRIAPDSVSKRFSDTTTPVSPTTSGKPPTFVTTGTQLYNMPSTTDIPKTSVRESWQYTRASL